MHPVGRASVTGPTAALRRGSVKVVTKAKTIVITGASDGIGAAAAAQLTEQGHQVVIVGRSPEKTGRLAEQLSVRYYLADYTDLDQVQALGEQLSADLPRIDVLANNAGTIGSNTREETPDGHEFSFQVNYLAPWYLTALLLPQLLADRATVINTSSMIHRVYSRFRVADLESRYAYDPLRAYANSKLASLLHVAELQHRFAERGLNAVGFHPGVIGTSFAADQPDTLIGQFYHRVGQHLPGPDKGADTLVWLAGGTPGINYPAGRYYINRGVAAVHRKAKDAELARELWDRTEQLLADRLD